MIKHLVLQSIDLLGLNALARWRHRGRIKVLLYHNITEGGRHFDYAITPEAFDRQIAYLKRCYNVVALDQTGEWIGYRRDRVNVLITFDDGFRNNLTVAQPILKRHGVRAVFFLIADCVAEGAPAPFLTDRLGDDALDPMFRTVDVADAKAMLDDGATIGSHSLAHRDHRSLSDDTDLADGAAARAMLEQAIGQPVANFAFPWGYHRPQQEAAFTRIYRRVFLTEHGFCGPDDRIIPRNEVANLVQMKAAASGIIDMVRRRGRT
jgi:peptidoglycan/xylan/chitin deacetylase (PgdA/CDA1 family)